jgi:hypothetical protein
MQATERERCRKVLDNICSAKNSEKSKYFLVPVATVLDPQELAVYRSEISEPRDLGTIGVDLDANKYRSASAFLDDINLCLDNAIAFNKTRYVHVANSATALKKVVRAEAEKHLAGLIPGIPVPAPKAIVGKKRGKIEFEVSCLDILNFLIGLDAVQIFLYPVNTAIFTDYLIHIDNPMDFSTIKAKLESKSLSGPDEFAFLVRRVFANCLRFNYHLRGTDIGQVEDTRIVRNHCRTLLFRFEEQWSTIFPNGKKVSL